MLRTEYDIASESKELARGRGNNGEIAKHLHKNDGQRHGRGACLGPSSVVENLGECIPRRSIDCCIQRSKAEAEGNDHYKPKAPLRKVDHIILLGSILEASRSSSDI